VRGEEVASKPAREMREQVAALATAGVGLVILSLSAPFDAKALRTFVKDIAPAAQERKA
jgi:hypothetical protein